MHLMIIHCYKISTSVPQAITVAMVPVSILKGLTSACVLMVFNLRVMKGLVKVLPV